MRGLSTVTMAPPMFAMHVSMIRSSFIPIGPMFSKRSNRQNSEDAASSSRSQLPTKATSPPHAAHDAKNHTSPAMSLSPGEV